MNQNSDASSAAAGVAGLIVLLFYLAVLVLIVAGLWRVFTKAGQPGWAAIIPIYNVYVLTQIAGKPGWWVLLYFVPIVSIVIAIIVTAGVASNFGKGVGFTIGLILLPFIFYPVLGFDGSTYGGVKAA
jgi:hypothetical protein